MTRVNDAVEASARNLVDALAGETGEGECDFASDVAAAHPLRIPSTILGVPQEAEADILRLTNQLFGADDPDLQREGEDPQNANLVERDSSRAANLPPSWASSWPP